MGARVLINETWYKASLRQGCDAQSFTFKAKNGAPPADHQKLALPEATFWSEVKSPRVMQTRAAAVGLRSVRLLAVKPTAQGYTVCKSDFRTG